jgi:crotonobetainyl-CoA:carnitine CoA-transferase CaiB-like acyl-CoA transferase
LEGIRVIDLSTFVAGPSTARLLAEWGADCIKVEAPGGDPARRQPSIFGMPYDDDENLGFDVGNLNKRFISVDLKNTEGKKIFWRLLESADVFVTNIRMQALRKLGIDYDSLKGRFPRLIFAHCMGYGENGPEKDSPGFDMTCYMGRGGLIGTTVNKGSPPMVPANGYGDFQLSPSLASGVCAALYNRERTGRGDYVTVSLHHLAVYMLSIAIVSAQYGNPYPKSRSEVLCPTANFYRTKDDKWIVLCVPEYDKDYNRVMRAIGREDLIDKEEYSTTAKMNELGTNIEIIKVIEDYVVMHDRDETVRHFKSLNIPCEGCYEPMDIHRDEQAWANGILTRLNCPSGTRSIPTGPVCFESNAGAVFKASSAQGTHTEEVLRELGYSEDEIKDAMEKGGVLGKTALFK